MSTQELEKLRKVSERYAYASLMYKFALAQALNHQADSAQLTLKRLCKMQSTTACASARRNWAELGNTKYPQLAQVEFPTLK
jgi:hypothetical protein